MKKCGIDCSKFRIGALCQTCTKPDIDYMAGASDLCDTLQNVLPNCGAVLFLSKELHVTANPLQKWDKFIIDKASQQGYFNLLLLIIVYSKFIVSTIQFSIHALEVPYIKN